MEPLRARRPAARARGFTLIELLVAMVIAAIAITTVAVNGWPGAQRGLRFEAERLALLLSLAREEAQVRGRPIRLAADREGYRFIEYAERRWVPIADDEYLRARNWSEPTEFSVQRPDGERELEFGRESVDVPFTIRLARDGGSATIVANGLGFFDVR
ncbi:MAG TPA: GspH/FimT family pseudopilin [Burkholderiaceae bacterium]